jgi:chemotaxis protein CheZ
MSRDQNAWQHQEKYLSHVDALHSALNSGQTERVNQLIEELGEMRESALYQQLDDLTREIHESVEEFYLDPGFSKLAREGIPEARERLTYVVERIEHAVHNTLGSTEASRVAVVRISENLKPLRLALEGTLFTGLDDREKVALLNGQLDLIDADINQLLQYMTDILMAQDYQDLTGQIIRQAVVLAGEIEDQLLPLVRALGVEHKEPRVTAPGGHIAIGPQLPDSGDPDVITSQDDVDGILAEHGF